MEREKLLKADYLDIIFDQRNKTYGGYELRKNYSQRTRNASSIVLFAAAVGFAIPALAGMLKKPVAMLPRPTHPPVVIFHPIEPIKPAKLLPTPPAAPMKPPKAELFVPPVITQEKDIRPEEQLVHNDRLMNAMISDTHTTGDATSSSISVPTNPGPPGTGIGTGPGVVETGNGKSNMPFTYVEQMPAFNGDINAFLSSHTAYPPAAQENGIQGRVVVQFVVNEDGSVSNATVLRSASLELDNEALRVVRSMPHWKAGKQNGSAVKVYFTLPITFTLDQ